MNDGRPFTCLIAAIGGEGGGLLATWVASAAEETGHLVQHTSVPGVAQRTGATIYYIESLSREVADSAAAPIFSLMPGPGDVDVVLASELVEAGRMLQRGFVSPDRTTLIGATGRVLTISEKMAMADGRLDDTAIRKAVAELTKAHLLVDARSIAAGAGVQVNAVLLGLLAASGASPYDEKAYRAAIERAGVAVAQNIQGFEVGFRAYGGTAGGDATPEPEAESADEAVASLPAPVQETAGLGVTRLADYQDPRYARLYLDRLRPVIDLDDATLGFALARETARHLALWMAYEDLMRVAQLKLRPDRWPRLAREAGAGPGDILTVHEFFKPGLPEWAALLPAVLGRLVLYISAKTGWKMQVAIHLNSTGILGTVMLRTLAALRRVRRSSLRYAQEQAGIERWLAAIARTAPRDYALALEIAATAQVNKGYGDTHARGAGNLKRLLAAVPRLPAEGAATVLRDLRAAALADPDQDMDAVIAAKLGAAAAE